MEEKRSLYSRAGGFVPDVAVSFECVKNTLCANAFDYQAL